VSACGENPFKTDRVHSAAECRVGALEDGEGRHGIDGKFEASVEKTGQVRIGEDPSITDSGVPYVCVLRPSGNRVAAAGPHFDLVAAVLGTVVLGTIILWTILGDGQRNSEKGR